jgi:hypothetical protein
LWVAAVKSSDPSVLSKVSSLIVTAKPKDVQAQLNKATIALLARRDGDAPYRQIEALYKANSTQPDAMAAYAFSLYRQGHMEEALTALRDLGPAPLRNARVAFCYGLILAAAGQPEKAEPYVQAGSQALLLPEERALSECLQKAFAWHAAVSRGDESAAESSWAAALDAARTLDALELLARLTIGWHSDANAAAALTKLVDTPNCPRWALDALWADAQKRHDTAQLYKVSRLLRIADPENRTIRANFIWLSLLTDSNAEMPMRQAEDLGTRYPNDPDCVAVYALSLHKLGHTEKGIAILEALPIAKLKTVRTALCYAVLLAAAGDKVKAQEFTVRAEGGDLLPEERAMLIQVSE